MTDVIKYNLFDAAEVPLNGSNLIEASAGTGKTYSIAILVLRLILEEKIAIKEILMVTFTKAAVAELEERVRNFIRSAYKVSQGKQIQDINIKDLVNQAIEISGIEEVQQLLKDAILFLDETSVLTIHSFCQQTLNEFAFETNQLFGAEMLPETQSVIEEELNKCWRNYITTLPVPLLKVIWNGNLKEGFRKSIEGHLSGKKYFGYDYTTDYQLTNTHHEKWMGEIELSIQKESDLRAALEQHVIDNTVRLSSTTNSYAKKNAVPLVGNPKDFLKFLSKKRSLANIIKAYPDILEQLETCDNCSEERDKIVQVIMSHLNCLAIQEVSRGVEVFKLQNNLLSYDDMILNLHKALVERHNPTLIAALQSKYKAVFVDEFQDTDRHQFEIFDKAFGDNRFLFYIGDPKQSIYAFRKADIFTYFEARKAVKQVYSMNQNYRSSAAYITAMNQFFLPADDFDTFYFNDEEEAIRYHPVESPTHNSKGEIYKGLTADVPISMFRLANNESIAQAVAAQVAKLLEKGAYSIYKEGEHLPIKPSDIGILVRKGKQGRSVKTALARLGIPGVTIDDSKVLQSSEATSVLYLLEAMLSPDRSAINRALLSPFTGFKTDDIVLLDDEKTLSLFSKYKIQWEKDGVYTAIMDFVADFNVRSLLLDGSNENGERIITNLLQIIELLHQVQSRKNLSMVELVSWLKRNINGMETEGDEYVQRVENDEDAVKIVTIHKSKGLEYNIVMAPFLDLTENKKEIFFSFRDPDGGEYIGVEKSRLTPQQNILYSRQFEQENRRLLYVALTRAVYKCYIFKSDHYKNSTLSTFLNALNNADQNLIRFEDIPVKPQQSFRKIENKEVLSEPEPVHFSLLEQNWRKMSYTMLSAKGEIAPRERYVKQEDGYNNFIFYALKRGVKTGNLLHYIFENINFSDDTWWDKILTVAISRFVPGQQDLYLPMLRRLLKHVFNTKIQVAGSQFELATVDYNKRIAEFEFDFPVPEFFADKLNSLSDDFTSVIVKGYRELNSKELEGIMNGKMDLFFEHLGSYYILDWKSNYLGPATEDYSPSALAMSMNESNYHLQYLIYTVAAKKYLESRLPAFDYETQFGGVIYLFIRGMRVGSDTGIFASKPALSRILKLESILGGISRDD